MFEIVLPDGTVLHNREPLRIEAMIGEKPPKERYVHLIPDDPIELFDENDEPTGIFIVKAEHNTGFVEVDQYESTTALVQLVGGPLGDEPQEFILSGPAEINVFFEGDEGDAEDDDGDGLDEVVTLMTLLNLTDGTLDLSLNPNMATIGEIEEKENNTAGLLDLDPFAPGDANSFFDVFFQIRLPDGTVVHNGVALRVEAMIGEKPPFDTYVHLLPPGGPLELLDANDNPTGVFITRAEHNTGFVERDIFEQTTALLQLQGGAVGPQPQDFILLGSAEAHVLFEGPNEGDAEDDDGDGLDEVETELVALNLTDGNVTLRLNPNEVSPGEIEEKQNNTPNRLDLDPFHPGDANSFFDVMFEIVLPDGTVLHNREPLRIEAMIGEKPPKERYVHLIPDDPIE
ncbi:MAG: hypothetical protein R3324_16335, partial [Halobacteriales archaeon]|nr:hypothetical protein [Halobacteriales archaeon]